MCSSRRDEASGSTNIKGREVLPTNVKPIHYNLTLEPNFEKFTYDGTVVIEYDMQRSHLGCLDADLYLQSRCKRGHELRVP